MTLVGATVALAFGATGLNTARLHTQEGGVEHALTQLDSRTAMVALGDSATQTVPLATAGHDGYHVEPDAGWINVTHLNYDGKSDGKNEVLFNETLGSLVYQDGQETIAYQGGGVWVASGNGSRMVSPPEFHYQSATLTLPVIRVEGSAAAGGSGVVATVTRSHRTVLIYPNETANYNGTGQPNKPYANPVHEGNVTVTVHSQFYRAWADYFRTRTAGEVTVIDAKQEARVKLISTGASGTFQMPADGNSLQLRGLDTSSHSVTNFTLILRPDNTDSADFSNLQWSLYAEKGSERFELHLRETGKNNALSTSTCTIWNIGATVYFSDTNGEPYQGWHNDTAFQTSCGALNSKGNNRTYLVADLTGSSPLTMQSLSSNDLHHFSASGHTLTDPAVFDQHPSVSWEQGAGTSFTAGNRTTIGNLTAHYLALMGPNVELTVDDQSSNTVNEAASSGNFKQVGGKNGFITFLHITENRVVVKLQ